MNKDFRIQKIQEIVQREKNNPDLLNHEIMWEKQLKSFRVFNIPLSYLVYNKYNGRILSRTKSLEKQKQSIDVETVFGRDLIEELLWNSKVDRNKTTLASLRETGQQKVGIITRDGVIIDGNRRAMLLNKIDRTGYFKAVVLPVALDENPLEVERLETTYQMGEDEKLSYNPTEKYLKAKAILDKLVPKISRTAAIKSISEWMGEAESEINKLLDTMEVMDEYLNYLEYDGIYTQLDELEDQFLSLTKWLITFYGETSRRAFDGYKDTDVDDLKVISFDYLRIRKKFDGKEFRNLGEGNKENHFFGDEDIWRSFSNTHFQILQNLPDEPDINYDSSDLNHHLNDRNNIFYESSKFEKSQSAFLDNIDEHKSLLGYNRAADEPEKLVKKSLQTFEAIKTNHSSFNKPEVQELVLELANKVVSKLQKKSPSGLLSHIIDLLEGIDIKKIPDDEIVEVLEKTKRIQQIGYQINKFIK